MRAITLLFASTAWLSIHAQCPSGEVPDCNGNCHPASWVGDGVCDDGITVPSNFMCEAFNWDLGDCGECNAGYLQDCNGNCALYSFLGDGNCQDSEAANFACSLYDWDAGDCPVNCPEGQIVDCSNQCWSSDALAFVGDWHCHSGMWGGGGWMYSYVNLDLDCEMFDFDGGDCQFWGCMDPAASNFYPFATHDDGSCEYGCAPSNSDCVGSAIKKVRILRCQLQCSR